jgi:hypothetical protein
MTTAFLIFRRATAPAAAVSQNTSADLVRLFALDRLPAHRRLVCHWQRAADGRLIGVWESELFHALDC